MLYGRQSASHAWHKRRSTGKLLQLNWQEFQITLKRLGDRRQWKDLRVDARVDGRALGGKVCLAIDKSWTRNDMCVATEAGCRTGSLRFVSLVNYLLQNNARNISHRLVIM